MTNTKALPSVFFSASTEHSLPRIATNKQGRFKHTLNTQASTSVVARLSASLETANCLSLRVSPRFLSNEPLLTKDNHICPKGRVDA